MTKNEEKLNVVSHLCGVFLAVLGTVVLLKNNTSKTEYSVFAICIYSAALILLYSASSLYHNATKNTAKFKLRILDHISIYALIAGTYTPVSLITLEQGNGWLIFYTVWGIALIGSVLKIFFTGKFEWLSLVLYLAMGWLIVLDFQNLVLHTTTTEMVLLSLGGFFYTVGILFYAVERIPYNHFIWHLFVLAGSIFHYFFILELI